MGSHVWQSHIGSWRRGDPPPKEIPKLAVWADARGMDAAIWTALGPRFKNKDTVPSAEDVVEFILGMIPNTARY